MTTPAFASEGCRIGGLTSTTIAMVGRTDSEGANLYLDIYNDKDRLKLVTSSSAALLTSDNNYQATAYVSGLTPNRQYWWRARADDGAGNSLNGSENTWSAGVFTTLSESATHYKICVLSDRPWGMSRNNATYVSMFRQVCANLGNLGLTAIFLRGDVYYSDIGTEADNGYYDVTSWYVPVLDADATIEKYRSNFITTQSLINESKKLHANIPTFYMWDDHDRCKNDCGGREEATGDLATRWNNARQAGHEAYMGLNKPLIDAEAGRTWTHNVSEDSYYYIDIPPVRWIVTDNRSFRSLKTDTDSTSKTMLGATQKAWLKNLILNNDQDFLVILSPIMFDGYHGWNESTNDGWVSYSYERDEIIDYIQTYGKPEQTIIASGDTHIGCVATYRGASSTNSEIYEITAGHNWAVSGHDVVNGWKAGATGNGGEPKFFLKNKMCTAFFEVFSNRLVVSIITTEDSKIVWSREFKVSA